MELTQAPMKSKIMLTGIFSWKLSAHCKYRTQTERYDYVFTILSRVHICLCLSVEVTITRIDYRLEAAQRTKQERKEDLLLCEKILVLGMVYALFEEKKKKNHETHVKKFLSSRVAFVHQNQ